MSPDLVPPVLGAPISLRPSISARIAGRSVAAKLGHVAVLLPLLMAHPTHAADLAADSTPVNAPVAKVSTALGRGVQVTAPADGNSLRARAFVRFEQDIGRLAPLAAVVNNAQLHVEGVAPAIALDWRLQMGFAPDEMSQNRGQALQTAIVRHAWRNGAYLAAGRDKLPFSAQRLAHSSQLQFAGLSADVAELHPGRGSGVFGGTDPDSRFDAAWAMAIAGSGGFVATRVRIRPLGAFDDSAEGDFGHGLGPRLALAGSFAFVPTARFAQIDRGNPYVATAFDYSLLGASFAFKWRGFSMHSEWSMRSANTNYALRVAGSKAVAEWSREAWGAHVQAGQMLSPWLQIAVRMARLKPLAGTDPALEPVREWAAAATWYLQGNDLKLIGDWAQRFGDDPRTGFWQARAQLALFW